MKPLILSAPARTPETSSPELSPFLQLTQSVRPQSHPRSIAHAVAVYETKFRASGIERKAAETLAHSSPGLPRLGTALFSAHARLVWCGRFEVDAANIPRRPESGGTTVPATVSEGGCKPLWPNSQAMANFHNCASPSPSSASALPSLSHPHCPRVDLRPPSPPVPC